MATGAACAADVDVSKLPAASTKKGLTYEKDVKAILDASCVKCHNGDRAKGELHLDSLEGILKGGEHGKAVVAGKGEKSSIVIASSRLDPEFSMPPMPKPGQFKGGPGGGPGGPAGGPGGHPEGGPPPGGPGAHGGGPGGKGFGPPPKPLTPEQVGLLRAWIDQGAK